MEELRQHQPSGELFLIIGADSLHDLPGWVQPRHILELAALLVVPRPGCEMVELETLRQAFKLPDDFPLRLQMVRAPLIDIASRDVRQRIAQGRSVRYLVPRAVEAYAAEKGLYRA